MNDIVKVAAAAIVAAICSIVVRRQTPEIGLLLSACAGVLILLGCSGALGSVVDMMDRLIQISGLQEQTVKPVLKVTGIAVVTGLAADICRDAGESALASVVETAGTAISLFAVLPLLAAILELVYEYL